MKIFLTGATGFIGGRLAERLAQDHEVRALVRTPAKAGSLEALGVELVPGDLNDRAALARGMDGCDAVVHGAAMYVLGRVNPDVMEEVNVGGTRRVLEAAREAGIENVVYISSVAAKGDTGGVMADETFAHRQDFPSHYERTKFEAHQVADAMIAKGLPVKVVMPGVVYGPGDQSSIMQYLRDFVRRTLPARVGEETVYSFVHVDDVVDGIVRVLTRGKPAQSYLLAGFPHSFRELNLTLVELTGVRPPRFALPLWLARIYARVSDFVGHVLGRPVLVSREGVESVADRCYAFDSTRAIRDLGWAPRPLRAGLVPTLRSLGATVREPRAGSPSP